MKKYFFLAMALCAGFAFTSCDDDDDDNNGVLTATVSFEGDYWNKLIDDKQMYGSLLYGDGSYRWEDEATKLASKLTNAWGDGMFWGGGIAISNYVDADFKAHTGSNYQLTVPVSNGSNNFAVAYCEAHLTFADGKAHVIQSMDVIPTNYVLGSISYGDGYASALIEKGDYLTVVATADNEKTLEFDLARDGNIQTTWKHVDFSSLGAVKSITFTMKGSDNSEDIVKSPAYFAFDNVVVEL